MDDSTQNGQTMGTCGSGALKRQAFLPEQGGLCDLVRLEEGFHPWHPDASGDTRLAVGARPPLLSPGLETPIKHRGFDEKLINKYGI